MSFIPEAKGANYSRLKTQLNKTKFAQQNNPAYQVMDGLIAGAQTFQNEITQRLDALTAALNAANQLPANSLLGRGSGGSGPVQAIRLGDGLIMNGRVLDVRPSGWDLVLTKPAVQDVVNSTTFVDDDYLYFTVFEFECWRVDLEILYAGSSAASDIKFNFNFPLINGWMKFTIDNNTSDTLQFNSGLRLGAAESLTTSIACGTDAAYTPRMAQIQFMFRAGVDGEFKFQFANNAAGTGAVSRIYDGSKLFARRLSVVPFGIVGPPGQGGGVPGGGGGSGGGGGGYGANSKPPTVPLPNLQWKVQEFSDANPGLIQTTEESYDFINGCVAALQSVDPRCGRNGKRGGSEMSHDAIAYYHGPGSPTVGSLDVYVVDIISQSGTPQAAPAWQNVTSSATDGKWLG
jgi:hypothetical protein